MYYSINSYITPRAAAKLLITNEIDLLSNWPLEKTKDVLNELLDFSIEEVACLTDIRGEQISIDSGNIPQFGKIDTVIRVPQVMIKENANNVDYVQLGFLLKKDPKASVEANQKFGENHGKLAAQTGIINCIANHFVPSTLTTAFVCLYSEAEQKKILARLMFRVPIIQVLIRDSQIGIVNGYDYMMDLSNSTKERRGSSVREILEIISEEGDDAISESIRSIVWNK